MIILDQTFKSLQVDLDAAVTTNQLQVVANYVSVTKTTSGLNATEPVLSQETSTNDTTAVTVVRSPVEGEVLQVKRVSIYNADTVAATVSVIKLVASTSYVETKVTLQAGESYEYNDGEGWRFTVQKKSVESTLNSTTSTLSGGATFAGTAELNDYTEVMASCYADVAGTLYFDFSVNGTDWRTFPTTGFAVAAGIHEFHTAVKGPRYFRVRYVNGASAQSTFQLYVYYGGNEFRQPSAPLNQPLGLDADAILVRPSFPWLDVSRGLTSGITNIKKFGRNQSVGTSYVPITLIGAWRTPQSGSATTLRVKAGGSANDTAAGSGARSVTIEGLDQNFAAASETIATAGASASSATTTTFTRVNRVYVASSGTYATASAGSHSSAITIENGAGGTDWAKIDATSFPKAQGEIGAYGIPDGYTAYVFINNITIDTTKATDVIFFWRGNSDETSAPYTPMRAQSVKIGLKSNAYPPLGTVPLGPYAGPADIGFMAKVDAGTASVSVEFEIFLIAE